MIFLKSKASSQFLFMTSSVYGDGDDAIDVVVIFLHKKENTFNHLECF